MGSGSPPRLVPHRHATETSLVIADIMRVSISTFKFAPCFSDVCMKTSVLLDRADHTDVLRRAKIAR